jgi:hypothetical protein
MSEQELRRKIKRAFSALDEHATPDFERVFTAAERSYGRPRRRYVVYGGIAATVAIVVFSMGNWQAPNRVADDEFLIADALLNSTGWLAPSDALMPEHQFDIYQDIPLLMESTDMQEGPLL